MSGTRCGRLRLSFPRSGFRGCFGGNRRTLALGGRVDGRRRRRLSFYWSFLRKVSRLPLPQTAAKLQRYLVVQGTGVRLLIRDSELGQQIEEDIRFYFELASQLIDANFTHTERPGSELLCARVSAAKPFFFGPTPSYRGSGKSVFSIVTDSFSGSADKISRGGFSAAASPAATASAALSPAGASSGGGSPAEASSEPSNWP